MQNIQSQFKNFFRRYGLGILTILLFGMLFAISVFYLLRESRVITDELITRDVKSLAQIFRTIDQQCKIIGFEHQKNHIDFLTVERFIGSEVGSMNLMLPADWHGPYMRDNPEVQGQSYLIVRTKKGYFITPGEGVRLSNGKVVGKDIILDEYADIEALIRDPQALNYQGKPLAAGIPTSGVTGKVILNLPPDGDY